MFGDSPLEEPWSGHKPITELPNPGYLQTIEDTVYNVRITCISDETVFGKSGAGIMHQYSKVQKWNSDMTIIWLGFNIILNGAVRYFGHSRSDYSGYLEEAKAVVSPGGSKVIFTSNWNVMETVEIPLITLLKG